MPFHPQINFLNVEKAIWVIYFNRYLNPLWPGGGKRLCPCHNLPNILLALSSTPMPLTQPDIWALAKNTAHSKLKWNSLMSYKTRRAGDQKRLFGHSDYFMGLLFTERTQVYCCNLMNLSSQGLLSLLILCFSPWDVCCGVVSLFFMKVTGETDVYCTHCSEEGHCSIVIFSSPETLRNSFHLHNFLTPLQCL